MLGPALISCMLVQQGCCWQGIIKISRSSGPCWSTSARHAAQCTAAGRSAPGTLQQSRHCRSCNIPQFLEFFYQYPTIFMQGECLIVLPLRRRVSVQLQLGALCMP